MSLNCRLSNRAQRGFLIPLAAFLVVAMGFMAAAMLRATSQTNLASSQELYSQSAFYAAESGAQGAMSVLFYGTPDKDLVDAACGAMNITTNYTAPGMNVCSSVVTCGCNDESGAACSVAAQYSFYRLISTGRCETGPVIAVRTVEVSAYLQ